MSRSRVDIGGQTYYSRRVVPSATSSLFPRIKHTVIVGECSGQAFSEFYLLNLIGWHYVWNHWAWHDFCIQLSFHVSDDLSKRVLNRDLLVDYAAIALAASWGL